MPPSLASVEDEVENGVTTLNCKKRVREFISQKIAKELEIHMDCDGTFDTFWAFLYFIFTVEKETNARRKESSEEKSAGAGPSI